MLLEEVHLPKHQRNLQESNPANANNALRLALNETSFLFSQERATTPPTQVITATNPKNVVGCKLAASIKQGKRSRKQGEYASYWMWRESLLHRSANKK